MGDTSTDTRGSRKGHAAPSVDDLRSSEQPHALARGGALLAASLRLAHTVSEGCVEALLNVANNAADLLPRQLRRRAEPYADADLTGQARARERAPAPPAPQVAIVTGGNAGIGFATAQQLARRGAHVVIACRDAGRAEAAVQAIARSAPLVGGASPASSSSSSPSSRPPPPAPPPRVEAMPLDLGRLASVRAFAEAWRDRGLPLHLLVCNAGVMAPLQRTTTEDGLEVQFQVNFLSHWLLAHLLLGHERSRRRGAAGGGLRARRRAGGRAEPGGASGPPPPDGTRVVVVSSVVHRAGPLQWHDLLSERSNREHGPHDSAVAVHPGIVRTALANNFFRSYGLSWAEGTPLEPLRAAWRAFLDTAGQAMLGSTEHAAERMLHACLAPTAAVAGRYMSMGRLYTPDKAADDPAYAADLWGMAVRLTGHTPHASLA
ncbi:hypothetical protein GPECTOR_2g990 [Gonium pectorale]|uniref:WW domain-containing oxidoreductase n=1 Tax=Gonium pectorale TaxID=33097 RepID=A0A150H2P5_GONPE|nr:hypothetical protein GPECTOR_2g990 [Gonium pectorale]|eukprot:KXZ56108.1 hypothetical protein GPECTOR_2g990 [Gonium pectorale]